MNYPNSLARIFGMFNCCRVPLSKMPALSGRGEGGFEDFNDEDEDTVCKYIHIQACGPGGIADADDGLAKRLHDHCIKMSKRAPVGQIKFPRDWIRVKWAPGEVCLSGGDDYNVEFKPQ